MATRAGLENLYLAVYQGDFEETKRISDYFCRKSYWRPGVDLLCTALVYRHLEIARLFLRQGSEVINDRSNHGGYTALHLAVLYGDSMLVQTILRKGAFINVVNLEGMSPLHLIVYRNHDEFGRFPVYEFFDEESSFIIKLLCQRGSNINSVVACGVKQGFTVFHLAAECGNENIIPILLDYRADINQKTREGLTPLHVAAITGNWRIVRLLLNFGAVAFAKDIKGKTALRWALEKKHEAAAELFINYQIPPWQNQNLPQLLEDSYVLLSAINLGNVSFVESLLNKGFSVNTSWRNRETALHVAINKGIEEIVVLVLNRGADLNRTTKDGKTPLYLAVERGVARIVEILLDRISEHNFEMLSSGPEKCCPLHVAVMSDNLEIVQLLLNKGTSVYKEILESMPYNYSESLLYIAAKNGNSSMCKLLVDSGADINAKDSKGRNAIYFAAERGNLRLVRDLSDISLKQTSKPNEWKDGYPALYVSACNGNDRIVDLLLKKGVDLKSNIKGYSTPLHAAAERGYETIVQLLVENGFDVNVTRIASPTEKGYGYTPLFYAAQSGKPNIVRMLLENGAEVNVKTMCYHETPLLLAILFENVDAVQSLVDYGADLTILGKHRMSLSSYHPSFYSPCTIEFKNLINYKYCSPLTTAVATGNDKVIDILLKAGAPAEVENEETFPLHLAARYGMSRIVMKLFEQGANINSTCSLGHTPVSHAVEGGHIVTMNSIIKEGAKLNIKTKEGDSLLHIVIKSPYTFGKLLLELLKCDLDVKARNNNEETALHCFPPNSPVAIRKTKNLFRLLLDYGAEINARDKIGDTPLHKACFRIDSETVRVLLRFGADINSVNLAGETALGFLSKPEFRTTNDEQVIESMISILKLFCEVIVVHETAGLHINETDLQFIKQHLLKYYEKCKIELSRMNCVKLLNASRDVSFRDILIKNNNTLDVYFRNNSIVTALISTDFENFFPIYAPMLRNCIEKANERKLLLESSVKYLESILDFQFPSLVVQCIFAYLSTVDLKNMERAFIPPHRYFPRPRPQSSELHNHSDQ